MKEKKKEEIRIIIKKRLVQSLLYTWKGRLFAVGRLNVYTLLLLFIV